MEALAGIMEEGLPEALAPYTQVGGGGQARWQPMGGRGRGGGEAV
jgi:hypothetical protein